MMKFSHNETPKPTNRTSAEGVALIKHYEGCRLQAYLDPAGIITDARKAELLAPPA